MDPQVTPTASVSHSAADQETLEKLNSFDHDAKDQWTDAASRLVRQFSHIIVNPITASDLEKAIMTSELGKAAGNSASLVLIHFDSKLNGESITSPHLREAPLQEPMYQKLVSSVLSARNPEGGQKPSTLVRLSCSWMAGGMAMPMCWQTLGSMKS